MRLSTIQKKEALENALKSFNFHKKFCIKSDEILGKTFAIAEQKREKGTSGNYDYLQPITNFMSYEECNAYIKGAYDTQKNKFNFF